MSGNKGGAFVLAVGIFSLGFMAAPDARVDTETEFVTVRIPDTHVVEKIKTVYADEPKVCQQYREQLEDYAATIDIYAGIVSGTPQDISEARKAIVDKDLPGTTKALENLDLKDSQADSVLADLMTLEERVRLSKESCENERK